MNELITEGRFYHYINNFHIGTYNIDRTDNEFVSATKMQEQLSTLLVPDVIIQRVFGLIMATASHAETSDFCSKILLDLDLVTFGQEDPIYKVYAKNIRFEYGKYSDAEYKNGKLNVIENFLEKKRIYQTDDFFNTLEQTARKNLKQEKELLLSDSIL